MINIVQRIGSESLCALDSCTEDVLYSISAVGFRWEGPCPGDRA